MILATPSTWTDSLAWFIDHMGERLEVKLAHGGLGIDGITQYEAVDQRHGAFGVVLSGLCWWIAESEIKNVWIDPDTDAIMVLVEPDACLYLRPLD